MINLALNMSEGKITRLTLLILLYLSFLSFIIQFAPQKLCPIIHVYIYIFDVTKPNISFSSSLSLGDIGLQSLQLLYPILLEFALIYQYNYQNLLFGVTKPNISFLASLLLGDIGLQRYQPLYPILLEFAIVYQYFYQN